MRAKTSFSETVALLALTACLWTTPAPAETGGCGVYEIQGTVRHVGDDYVLVTAEGSQSETVFSMPMLEGAKLVSFAEATVKCEAEVSREIRHQKGWIRKLISIRPALANPMDPASSRYRLLKKTACGK